MFCVGIWKITIPCMSFPVATKSPAETGRRRVTVSIITLMSVSGPVFHAGRGVRAGRGASRIGSRQDMPVPRYPATTARHWRRTSRQMSGDETLQPLERHRFMVSVMMSFDYRTRCALHARCGGACGAPSSSDRTTSY